MININEYLAKTTQDDLLAAEQTPYINPKTLPQVTNQGIYHAKVLDAYLNEYNGRLKITLNTLATLEGMPDHSGLLKLYIDVFYVDPNGNNELSRHFISLLSSCKCFDAQGRPWAEQEEKVSSMGTSFTVITNLLEKEFFVAMVNNQASNGQRYLNPLAFFDSDKRSYIEACSNKPAKYIEKFAYLVPEGFALKAPLQEPKPVPVNNGFSMPGQRPANQGFAPQSMSNSAVNQAPGMQQPYQAQPVGQQVQAFNPWQTPQQNGMQQTPNSGANQGFAPQSAPANPYYANEGMTSTPIEDSAPNSAPF